MPSSTTRPPYISSLLAATFVLFLLGMYVLALNQGRQLVDGLRESTTLVAELRPTAATTAETEVDAARVNALQEWLEQQPFVKSGSVTLITKEQGAQRLREEFGDDFMNFDLENPLTDVITLNLDAQTVASGRMEQARLSISERPEVLDAYVQEGNVALLASRLSDIGLWGSVLGAVLLLGVVLLLLNTTRLALLNKAQLIKNMELVGASWGFISAPFLKRAVLLGALSGVLAVLLVIACSAYAKTQLTDIWADPTLTQFALLGGALILVGVFINFATTFFVIRRTLKMRVDDLAALR